MEPKETKCDQPKRFAPESQAFEYTDTVVDRRGLGMVVLRRFGENRHKCEGCWKCCCLFCWCCGRFACCWKEKIVAEVEMPAGKRIATISYAIGIDGRSRVLRVVNEEDATTYSVLLPKVDVPLTMGGGPTFQLFRDGVSSPIGRIQRMIDTDPSDGGRV